MKVSHHFQTQIFFLILDTHGEVHQLYCKFFYPSLLVAISQTGDIISVCRSEGDNIRGTDLLKIAIQNGGVKLDSYDGNHLFYTKNGFEPISWCRWEEEYAPDGWNGEPENIIFYKYTGNTNPELSASTFYKRVNASLDYDEAEKIRNEAIGGKN